MIETQFEKTILKTLIYFSIFQHPLTLDEITLFSSIKISHSEVESALKNILAKELILQQGDYYMLFDADITKNVKNREKYESIYQNTKDQAQKSAKLIASFPFVRGVLISGSMSKGLVKADGDIDFFIITKQGRLWVCRTLLIIYKKFFKFNSHKYFCLNYFVGEESMNIPDENIFTATEIASMIPMYNMPLCKTLKEQNDWHLKFLPNYTHSEKIKTITYQDGWLKRSIERVFNHQFGQKFDLFLMRTTLKRWMKKFPTFTPDMMELAMRSKRNVSKHHPNNFQQKVLDTIKNKELFIFEKLERTHHV
jgi:hypothetical protein